MSTQHKLTATAEATFALSNSNSGPTGGLSWIEAPHPCGEGFTTCPTTERAMKFSSLQGALKFVAENGMKTSVVTTPQGRTLRTNGVMPVELNCL